LDFRVAVSVFADDFVQDSEEVGIFAEGVWCGWDLGCGAHGEKGERRSVGEQGEEVGFGEVVELFVDVL
jgi:hypothetical protein